MLATKQKRRKKTVIDGIVMRPVWTETFKNFKVGESKTFYRPDLTNPGPCHNFKAEHFHKHEIFCLYWRVGRILYCKTGGVSYGNCIHKGRVNVRYIMAHPRRSTRTESHLTTTGISLSEMVAEARSSIPNKKKKPETSATVSEDF